MTSRQVGEGLGEEGMTTRQEAIKTTLQKPRKSALQRVASVANMINHTFFFG
jgi:hypothetical protein